MAGPLRIAMFLGSFPVVSETFILRQITGLLDLGHSVHIFANSKPDTSNPVHAEVANYRLLERTTYIDGPPEAIEWEMPVFPLTGRTWPPGSNTSIHNSLRAARALAKILRCLSKAPRLTFQALSSAFNDFAPQLLPEFIARFRPLFPVGHASRASVYDYLKLPSTSRFSVPIYVFIDKKGMIREQHNGEDPFFQAEDKNTRALIETLLNEKGKK